jgi:hypothetical protein
MNIDERDERLVRICEDIDAGEVLLQPDFQRGEVWSSSKKKLLIDTILRKWHIPPVHVVAMDNGSYEVLDGQQRLTAIRDFVKNKFSIDGHIEPKDDSILELNGKKYKDLDGLVKRDFDRYTLKINEINNYNPGEPSELFHRLNQTVKLTSSEARNAIYGSVRNCISELVEMMGELGVNKDILGFSNSRMSYNDLLSRIIVFLETGTLRAKITESTLNNRYRDDGQIDLRIIDAIKFSIELLSIFNNNKENYEHPPSLTKASSLSWMYIICVLYLKDVDVECDRISTAFFALEVARSAVKNNEPIPSWILKHFDLSERTIRDLMHVYIERSSSRVMSIGSILARDILQSISIKSGDVILPISKEDYDLLSDIVFKLSDGLDAKAVIEGNLDSWKVESI